MVGKFAWKVFFSFFLKKTYEKNIGYKQFQSSSVMQKFLTERFVMC